MAEKSKLTSPMRVETPEHQTTGMVNHTVFNPGFSGVARSIECFDNHGNNNFRILTLHIEDGVVKKMDRSDPYANWEAMSRIELWNEFSLIHLNNTWQNGKTLSK